MGGCPGCIMPVAVVVLHPAGMRKHTHEPASHGCFLSELLSKAHPALVHVTPWVKPQNRFLVTMLRNVGGASLPGC